MKTPTLRKLHNRDLTPIRYHTDDSHSAVRHGWIVEQGERGTMTIRLVGEDRNRRLSRAEARHVEILQ